jgi:hypothetical protein
MLETKHFLNGNEIRPLNFSEMGFKIDYSQDYNLPELNTETVILVNEAKTLVDNHILSNGVFEGIPYDITFGDTTLNYYIDLTDNVVVSDSQIEVKIKRRKSVSNFMENANGLTFEYLSTVQTINFVNVDFIVVKDNQEVQLILFLLNTYVLAKELAESINNTISSAQDVIKASVPNAGVPPSVDLGDIIAAIALLLMRIIYTAFILLQIIDMVKKIIEILVPAVRQLKATTVIELINKGCADLGYTFQSTLIPSNLTIAPVPLHNPEPTIFEVFNAEDSANYTKGYPTALDSVTTLGELIDVFKEYYNADLSVNGNVVSLEPYTQVISTTIKNTLNIQSKRENGYTFNTAESWKRYLVKYQFDTSDLHTLNNYQKAQAEYSTEPINSVNPDLVTIKGLVSINIPFAYGVRKNKLNFVEDKLLKLAEFADEVISAFGGNGNNASKIKGRVGVMQVSQKQYSVTKLLYLTGNKQPTNYLEYLGAKAVFENHESNNVKENFKRVYTSTIPLSGYKFNDIINGGNTVQDEITDEILEIISIEWINENVKAEINYTVKSEEGFNTKTIQVNG